MKNTQQSKAEKIKYFNPDGVGSTTSNIFGLPFTTDEADVVIIPVPWDVTVSSMEGTSLGPENIFRQSSQIDLFDEFVKDPWKAGIAMEEIPQQLAAQNLQLRNKAITYIQWLEEHGHISNQPALQQIRDEINLACQQLENDIYNKALQYLDQGKLPVILGGDHSTPLGLIRALTEKHPDFGLLQIDAHADLRPAYEGFTHSHASIMYNAMAFDQISHFVQVGLRDFCTQEKNIIDQNPQRFSAYFGRDLQNRSFEGESWKDICQEIIAKLPPKVYISFDIDGLDPAWCPSTGTPVPGGLSYSQVLYLFEQLTLSGRTIIGFDLVETGPDTIDGIIACRILYKTIAMLLKSNQRI